MAVVAGPPESRRFVLRAFRQVVAARPCVGQRPARREPPHGVGVVHAGGRAGPLASAERAVGRSTRLLGLLSRQHGVAGQCAVTARREEPRRLDRLGRRLRPRRHVGPRFQLRPAGARVRPVSMPYLAAAVLRLQGEQDLPGPSRCRSACSRGSALRSSRIFSRCRRSWNCCCWRVSGGDSLLRSRRESRARIHRSRVCRDRRTAHWRVSQVHNRADSLHLLGVRHRRTSTSLVERYVSVARPASTVR